MNFTFSAVPAAYAHEEGATAVTPDNAAGPILAFAIIIAAVIIAKRINRKTATHKHD